MIHFIAPLVSMLALLALAVMPAADVSAQARKVLRVGTVGVSAAPTGPADAWDKFKTQLAEHGFIEGKNIVFEQRWANADYRRMPELLADLERAGVDVIFAPGSKMARISQSLVKRTPLVVYSCDAFDHVSRLARQGGNVTGVTCMTSELTPKRLELLKEAVPSASRIVFLSEPEDSPSGLKRAVDAAPRLGITLTPVGFKAPADMPRALEMSAKERPDALFVYPDPIAFIESRRITTFALEHRLPTMFAFRDFVDVGGLISYGANNVDMFKQAADQAAKILNGTAPGDLPMLQATRFELVINQRTAKAVGLKIPTSLLVRADHVIE